MPYFSILADLLMIAASSGAAVYCLILSRRLSRLSSFDKGIGGAIAVLSAQVDEMKVALAEARVSSDGASHQLQDLVRQAREISGELELMIAACHDFAEEAMTVQGAPTPPEGRLPATPRPDPIQAPASSHPITVDVPDPVPEAPGMAVEPLMFGSRRGAAAQPVFLRHGQG